MEEKEEFLSLSNLTFEYIEMLLENEKNINNEESIKKVKHVLTSKSVFYLVHEEILPEAILKTIRVKEILLKGEAKTVNEAVAMMDLSRSAFYKYKDSIFPLYQASKDKIITIALMLEYNTRALLNVLNAVNDVNGEIITVNQDMPAQCITNTTISIDTKNLNINLETLIENIRNINGVMKLEILGQV